ncbi:MAG: hypothetical protein QF879_01400 [Candidatus Latescibacteria bacterium]|nr:hypothetical protein [Candidatus Latescibacterota bacterium]
MAAAGNLLDLPPRFDSDFAVILDFVLKCNRIAGVPLNGGRLRDQAVSRVGRGGGGQIDFGGHVKTYLILF